MLFSIRFLALVLMAGLAFSPARRPGDARVHHGRLPVLRVLRIAELRQRAPAEQAPVGGGIVQPRGKLVEPLLRNHGDTAVGQGAKGEERHRGAERRAVRNGRPAVNGESFVTLIHPRNDAIGHC